MRWPAARRHAVAFIATVAVMASPSVIAVEPTEPLPWASASGDGCAKVDGQSATPLLRLEAGPLATCSLSLEHPRRAAGRRVEVSASFRTVPGDDASVALLLTQFRGNSVIAHRFSTASIDHEGVATLAVRGWLPADGDRVVVGMQSVGAHSTVEVTDLALATSTEPLVEGAMSDAARDYLDRALRLIVDRAFALDPAEAPSLLRESRALATGATTVEETHDAIRHALARIDDGHSRLLTSSDVTAWTSVVPRPPYDIERRAIDSRIGYVRVPGFASLREEQRRAYARFLGWTVRQSLQTSTGERNEGLVVDLRSDEGGSFLAMLEGMCGLFDGRRALGGFEDRAGRRRQSWTCPTGAARSIDGGRLPVAVLVGPRTASAGEMLAIALRGRARTVLIGAPTRGLTTGVELVPMSDGAQLALATTVSIDAGGHAYRAGVVPDIAAPLDGAPGMSDRSIAEAVAWIDAQAANGRPLDLAPRAVRRQRVPAGPRAAAGISKSG